MTRRFLFVLMTLLGFGFAASAAEVGGDGLHKQPWFLDSFLEFSDDLKDAAAQGKDLMIIIEQEGCPYCRELHRVNFSRPEIVEYIQAHFVVVQLDLYGSRGTVDFDGEAMEEKDVVSKWGAQFTPTTIIFSGENADATSARDAEVFRMPGYLKPFHYITSLEYIATDAYKDGGFQRFLKAKILDLEAKGITADVW